MSSLDVPLDVAAKLDTFTERVKASPHNLVSRQAREELRERHIPECVAFARMLPNGPLRVLDVGSGGGFPGVVIAAARPDLTVDLLDATAKKTDFLATIAAELGLDVEVHTGRAEELAATELAGSFDAVTARAVAPLRRLIPWTMPFLRPGGCLYAIKGERWAEELSAAIDTLRPYNAEVVATPDPLATADPVATPLVVTIERLR